MELKLPQLNKTLSCDKGENLFRALRERGIPLASSCKGDGVCGKCVVSVVEGAAHLTPPTDLERKLMEKYHYAEPQRISCQCDVQGDVELKTTYW
jgi:2Fe-2S ferredoxin